MQKGLSWEEKGRIHFIPAACQSQITRQTQSWPRAIISSLPLSFGGRTMLAYEEQGAGDLCAHGRPADCSKSGSPSKAALLSSSCYILCSVPQQKASPRAAAAVGEERERERKGSQKSPIPSLPGGAEMYPLHLNVPKARVKYAGQGFQQT